MKFFRKKEKSKVTTKLDMTTKVDRVPDPVNSTVRVSTEKPVSWPLAGHGEAVKAMPPVESAPKPLTLLEKENKRLETAQKQLLAAQVEVAKICSNIAWLEDNPMAEGIFVNLLEREIQERDRKDLDNLVRARAASASV